MGFGVSFIRWVRLLYIDVRSSVLIIGYCFRAFRPSRWVRQGCPLSPLLYILSFEVLAAIIRCNPAISGLLPVLSLHADDTSVISCSDGAIKVLFEVYHRFERDKGLTELLIRVSTSERGVRWENPSKDWSTRNWKKEIECFANFRKRIRRSLKNVQFQLFV